MIVNRNILFSSIIAYFLLALYATYFKFFPIIISPFFSNLIIILIIILILSTLVFESFQLQTDADLYIILPQYLFFAFVTRAIPTLRFAYQPLSDPYYYFIPTLNITNYGTLDPVLSWWYGLLQQQLTWPNLHFIGSFLMDLTGIHSIDLLRYVPPIMGIFFFLGVFLLAKEVTASPGISLLAGLLAVTGDTVLFYQSEYHPQGVAFVYFIFLIVLMIRYFAKPNLLNGSLMFMYAIIFSFSHHFSSLFLGLLSFFIILSLGLFYNTFSNWFQFQKSKQFNFILTPWIFIAITMFFSHIFTYPAFMQIINKSVDQSIRPVGTLITMSHRVPLQITILNSTKYLLLFLAIISVIYIYKSRDKKEFFCFILFISILISGAVGTFVVFIPVDRLIGFYIPFTALFAALTLFRFHREWFIGWRTTIKEVLIIGVALIILLAGPLNFFPPSLIFHDSPKDPYYWHSNDLSGFSTYGVPGEWMKEFVSPKSIFSAYGDTFMIPYFYGSIPTTQGVSTAKSTDTIYSIYHTDFMNQQSLYWPGTKIAPVDQIYTIGMYGISV